MALTRSLYPYQVKVTQTVGHTNIATGVGVNFVKKKKTRKCLWPINFYCNLKCSCILNVKATNV